MATQLWSELEQEPYDPEEFVERLAWRAVSSSYSSGGNNNGDEFVDAQGLNDAFVQAIKDLTLMQEEQQKKCQDLEQKCREEEAVHNKKIASLLERNRSTATTYKSLDEKINSVATKVVHLGDQLESVNTPRSRDVEALKLMKHFEEFLGGETSLSPLFTDKARLHEAADIIQKLQLTAQELGSSDQFAEAKRRIDAKYGDIERSLIEEFVKSHRSNDKSRMKDLALILSQFKGYNACVDAFIEQVQLSTTVTIKKKQKDWLFKETVPLCETSWKVIEQVFPNPQQVMAKFVLNIYHSRLKEHVGSQLADKNNTEVYLSNLFHLYSSTAQLTTDLSHFNLGSSSGDHLFLSNLTKTIFRGYLETYINVESRYLNVQCASILSKYYEVKGHQKKMGLTGNAAPLQDLKRDLHGFIASKAHINIGGLESVSYGGETFLSEEVAINILQLAKLAFKRCQVLSSAKDLAGNAVEIFNILVSYLLHEHVDYALEVGLQGIPLPEAKSVPELFFFDVVGQTNAIIHLLEKQFSDSLVPLVASTPKHADCLQKKKVELETLERKVDAGLDRTLSALVGWVKTILAGEQKKSDFNPPVTAHATTSTTACMRVVKFVNYQVEKIRDSLDGKNIELVLLELGLRLHRVIYDHLQQFTYSSAGVMAVICDVQEYRRCVSEWKVVPVNALFDTLHAMCNLLILPPENLRGAAQGDQLASLDRTILDNWIQLRVDYKSERLGSYL